jgi:hypothetical protein
LTAISIQCERISESSTYSKQIVPPNIAIQNKNPLVKQNTYITWANYANDRRNSLQRRKVEISKRLENASKANKNPRKDINIDQFQSKDLQNRNKISNPISKQNNNNLQLIMSPLNAIDIAGLKNKDLLCISNNILNYLSLLNKDFEGSNDNDWVMELKTNVCNEFIKSHRLNKNVNSDLDHLENVDLSSNPAYKEFAHNKQTIDINQISEALLEHLEINNNSNKMTSFNNTENKNVINFEEKNSSLNEMNQQKKIQQSNKKVEEKLTYLFTHRWDPGKKFFYCSSKNQKKKQFFLISRLAKIESKWTLDPLRSCLIDLFDI